MATTLISNPVTTSTRESRKKKKKRNQNNPQNQSQNPNKDEVFWKSDKQQNIYSSKLLQALRQVRLDSSTTSVPRRGKLVHEAADRVLAVTAKGRTRWSRAILTNRLKIKFNKNLRRRRVAGAGTGASRAVSKARVSVLTLKSKKFSKNLPAVQRKARVLGRLVPGCRKESLPVVLEEAGDYIAALEMQVRAMAALAEILSGGSGSSSGAGSSTLPSTSC